MFVKIHGRETVATKGNTSHFSQTIMTEFPHHTFPSASETGHKNVRIYKMGAKAFI